MQITNKLGLITTMTSILFLSSQLSLASDKLSGTHLGLGGKIYTTLYASELPTSGFQELLNEVLEDHNAYAQTVELDQLGELWGTLKANGMRIKLGELKDKSIKIDASNVNQYTTSTLEWERSADLKVEVKDLGKKVQSNIYSNKLPFPHPECIKWTLELYNLKLSIGSQTFNKSIEKTLNQEKCSILDWASATKI